MGDPSEKSGFLSVVIPAYNEAHRLGATLRSVGGYLAARPGGGEIVVVDDGSKDGTAELARGFRCDGVAVRVLVNEHNRGKGYSVRRGMLEAAGGVLLMYDADGSTPIAETQKLEGWIAEGYGVVIGSRDLSDSLLDPPPRLVRRMMRRMFTVVRRAILLPDLIDTQCGFKCFTRAAAQDVFARQQEEGFGFDCEVLMLAQRMGHRIKEVGIVWRDDRQSTVKPLRDSLRMMVSLMRVRRRLREQGR